MKIKINISKLKKILRVLPKILARRAFLFLFLAILFDILLGSFIFYRYSFLPSKKEVEITEKPLMLEEKLLLEILKKLEERENRFEEEGLKVYSDPFRPEQLIEIEELTE